MEVEVGFSQISPPNFDGESYDLWIVRMESYMETLNVSKII